MIKTLWKAGLYPIQQYVSRQDWWTMQWLTASGTHMLQWLLAQGTKSAGEIRIITWIEMGNITFVDVPEGD